MVLEDNTPEGRKTTKLDQILLNGNHITMGYNKANKRLDILTLPNQDPLITHIPLLGVDVWEHAYYLQYKNARPDYLNKIWQVINWKTVAE
ncbi:4317_t:CDS:2, partial [Entrophospora sp. SA101]